MSREEKSKDDIEANVQNGGRSSVSAAMIDHTEVHIDLTKKKNQPGDAGGSEVKYTDTGTGHATVIVQTKPDPGDKPKDFVVTSCIVIMLCNLCWGIAGWHYGLKANYAWQLGDVVESRRQAKRAKILVICGVITGIITWVLSLTLFFTISKYRPGA